MQNSGGMFQFAIFTHGGSFAITFDRVPRNSQSRDGALREQFTEFFANVHQLGQVLDVFAGTGILDTATQAARRVGGWMARPISVQVSSTKVASLRILALMSCLN